MEYSVIYTRFPLKRVLSFQKLQVLTFTAVQLVGCPLGRRRLGALMKGQHWRGFRFFSHWCWDIIICCHIQFNEQIHPVHCFNLILWAVRKPLTSCVRLVESASMAYAAPPCAIHHLLHVLSAVVNVCVWRCPCRLPRDPPAADDGPAEVPPGEAGGAEGLLPAAQWHPGGALQERCGEEHNFLAFMYFYFPLGQTAV